MGIMGVGRRFFEATVTPSPAALNHGGRFPIVTPSDGVPPSVPGGLTATAASISQIDLAWNASTDTGGSGLVGYRLYRNGNVTPLVQQAGRTFSDTGLTSSTQYTYRVSAYDAAGNESAQSTAVSATTLGSGPQTINVSTATQLANAIATANSSGVTTTILLADGTYTLSATLSITATNLTVRSVSGIRANVIVQGDAMSASAVVGDVFLVNSSGVTIQDITIERCRWHAIQVAGENGGTALTVRNCILRDTYEHLLKGTITTGNPATGAASCLVENCLFTYTAGIAPNYYTGGIDCHAAKDWTVRNNTFSGIASPGTAVSEAAVHFWRGISGANLVEKNTIINCDRGVWFGLFGDGAVDTGGIIRSNSFYHAANGAPLSDVQIAIEDCTSSSVVNNTIYREDSYANAIEYRGTTTGLVMINNLTNKPITSRDGGTITTNQTNFTGATVGYFVDPASGNLHLATAIGGVVNAGTTTALATDDIDGQGRPQGASYDIGADEYVAPNSPTTQPRLTGANISYLGAFSLEQGLLGISGFAFGGFALTFYKDAQGRKTLFMQGNDQIGGAIAQVQIPNTLVQSTNWNNLPQATTLQNFADITRGHLYDISPAGAAQQNAHYVYGLMPWNGRIIVAGCNYYSNTQVQGIGSFSSLNLATGTWEGWTPGGLAGASAPIRALAGRMCVIPPEWRTLMGGPCLMGNTLGPLSNSASTSAGQAATVFDPDNIGVGRANTGKTALYFDSDGSSGNVPNHSMSRSVGGRVDIGNPVWAACTWSGGMFWAAGSRSLCVIQNHGDGPYCYGDSIQCPDQWDPDGKGPHMPTPGFGYSNKIAFYDANDFLPVLAGTQPTWNPQPYAVAYLPDGRANNPGGYNPNMPQFDGPHQPKGVTFDPETNRVYVTMDYVNNPRVEVWQVTVPSS